jgi:quercetin dioxygenase-like cupin family protein
MTARHLVVRAADAAYPEPPDRPAGSVGYGRWAVVDESVAVHTGFGICRLQPGGCVAAHLHSYEESVYVLDGELVLQTPGSAVRLGPGDHALVPVGVPHELLNHGADPVRWADMLAPVPRVRHGGDTFRVADLAPSEPIALDVRDPRTRFAGSIRPEHMDPAKQSQELLAVSASMRTALLVYSGITVKMMVDADMGAALQTMFMVQYEPGGAAGAHDHPFEETYLILDGEVDAELDGERYRLRRGDVAWAAAGCVHGFSATTGSVRWLETQAPQPPARHSYRFARDWDYLSSVLDDGGAR